MFSSEMFKQIYHSLHSFYFDKTNWFKFDLNVHNIHSKISGQDNSYYFLLCTLIFKHRCILDSFVSFIFGNLDNIEFIWNLLDSEIFSDKNVIVKFTLPDPNLCSLSHVYTGHWKQMGFKLQDQRWIIHTKGRDPGEVYLSCLRCCKRRLNMFD